MKPQTDRVAWAIPLWREELQLSKYHTSLTVWRVAYWRVRMTERITATIVPNPNAQPWGEYHA